MNLPRCNVYLEETGLYTRIQWDTYITILYVQVPLSEKDYFEKEANRIKEVATKIYGRQGDNILTEVDIGKLIEHYETIDLFSISITQVIDEAITDANLLMSEGKYSSAFDRVHIAFHGYLRKMLDNTGIFTKNLKHSRSYIKNHMML